MSIFTAQKKRQAECCRSNTTKLTGKLNNFKGAFPEKIKNNIVDILNNIAKEYAEYGIMLEDQEAEKILTEVSKSSTFNSKDYWNKVKSIFEGKVSNNLQTINQKHTFWVDDKMSSFIEDFLKSGIQLMSYVNFLSDLKERKEKFDRIVTSDDLYRSYKEYTKGTSCLDGGHIKDLGPLRIETNAFHIALPIDYSAQYSYHNWCSSLTDDVAGFFKGNPQQKEMAMPILCNNHWYAFNFKKVDENTEKVDANKEHKYQIVIFDSSNRQVKSLNLLDQIVTALDQEFSLNIRKNLTEIKFAEPKHAPQTNGYSCGDLVIAYLHKTAEEHAQFCDEDLAKLGGSFLGKNTKLDERQLENFKLAVSSENKFDIKKLPLPNRLYKMMESELEQIKKAMGNDGQDEDRAKYQKYMAALCDRKSDDNITIKDEGKARAEFLRLLVGLEKEEIAENISKKLVSLLRKIHEKTIKAQNELSDTQKREARKVQEELELKLRKKILEKRKALKENSQKAKDQQGEEALSSQISQEEGAAEAEKERVRQGIEPPKEEGALMPEETKFPQEEAGSTIGLSQEAQHVQHEQVPSEKKQQRLDQAEQTSNGQPVEEPSQAQSSTGGNSLTSSNESLVSATQEVSEARKAVDLSNEVPQSDVVLQQEEEEGSFTEESVFTGGTDQQEEEEILSQISQEEGAAEDEEKPGSQVIEPAEEEELIMPEGTKGAEEEATGNTEVSEGRANGEHVQGQQDEDEQAPTENYPQGPEQTTRNNIEANKGILETRKEDVRDAAVDTQQINQTCTLQEIAAEQHHANANTKPFVEPIQALTEYLKAHAHDKRILQEFSDNHLKLLEKLTRKNPTQTVDDTGEKKNSFQALKEAHELIMKGKKETTFAWLPQWCHYQPASIAEIKKDLESEISSTVRERDNNPTKELFHFHEGPDILATGRGHQYEVVLPITVQSSEKHIVGGKCYEGKGLFDRSSQGVNARGNNRVDFVIKLTKAEDLENILAQENIQETAESIRNAASMASVLQFMTNFKGSPSSKNRINLSYDKNSAAAQANAKQVYFALKYFFTKLNLGPADEAINIKGGAQALKAADGYEEFEKNLDKNTHITDFIKKFSDEYTKRKEAGQKFNNDLQGLLNACEGQAKDNHTHTHTHTHTDTRIQSSMGLFSNSERQQNHNAPQSERPVIHSPVR